jgi:tetratricopeptide (TPR) repeat protein
MAKSWKDSDLDYLRRYAQVKTLKQLAQRFGVEPAALAAKLAELDLTTKDGRSESGIAADPEVKAFEQALKDLHAGRVEKAAAQFEKVAAATDLPDVGDRARQYLAACRRRLAAATGGGEAVDPYLAAVVARNAGDLARAMELCKAGGRAQKDERFALLAAGVYALQGKDEEAAKALGQAVELNPKNRVHAFHDPDLAALRGKREHAHLFGLD